MNKLVSLASTYLRQLVTTLRRPEVRSQAQAVLRSAEMMELLGTVRAGLRGGTATSPQDTTVQGGGAHGDQGSLR